MRDGEPQLNEHHLLPIFYIKRFPGDTTNSDPIGQELVFQRRSTKESLFEHPVAMGVFVDVRWIIDPHDVDNVSPVTSRYGTEN